MVFNVTENQYYQNGKIFWSRVIEKYPQRATYWMGLGYYFYDKHDYERAASCAEHAIRLNPGIIEFYHKAALAYEKARNLKKASSLIEKVMTLEKDNSLNIAMLIKNNLRLGNYGKALESRYILDNTKITNSEKKEQIYSSIAGYFRILEIFSRLLNLCRWQFIVQRHQTQTT